MRRVYYIPLALLALMLVVPTPSLSQTLNPTQPDPVQYLTTPEVPGPGDRVYLEIQGVGSFLGNSKITWSQGGKVLLSGTGERAYTITAGELGGNVTVRATIENTPYGTLTHDFVIAPSLVNLVWEAQTSVPPFYRSKPLYSGGALVTVAAFPQVLSGKTYIAAKSLSFQWTLNNNLIPEQSGLGRSTFTFQGDQLKNAEVVEVDVLLGNKIAARGRVTIAPTLPQTFLYQRDPLRGEILEQALPANITLVGKELTVTAEPYYFSGVSTLGQSGNLQYTWNINGSPATGPDSARGVLTLRRAGDGAGSATLGVSVQNISSSQLVQAAQATLQVLFGQSASNSSFGI